MTASITHIQRFSLNDGPGIRTTLFFQGCNLQCAWCHNPETIPQHPVLLYYQHKCIGCGKCFEVCPTGAHQISGDKHIIDRTLCTSCGACAAACFADALVMSSREYTLEEVMREILQDKLYYDLSGGGVTVSGGEPTLQAGFLAQLADACHANGIRIAIETNMTLPFKHLEFLLSKMDLIMCDLKQADPALHTQHTGVDNQTIIHNISRASLLGIPIIVRTPLIPGATDSMENLHAIATFLASMPNILQYELLNYNPLGSSKRAALDVKDPFGHCKSFSNKQLEEIKAQLSDTGVSIRTG